MGLMFPEPLHVGRPNIGSRADFDRLVTEIFDRHWLTNAGPLVVELERRIADLLGVRHCVTMANGTIALEIAIRALGITGEVIVPSYTFVATAHALHWQGIRRCSPTSTTTRTTSTPIPSGRMITPRTSGIIGVHLWGRPAPVQELQAIATEHGLEFLFDAAHAFGSSCDGRMIGSFGRAEVLSFHATKFFNTFEGGAVVTNDDDLAQQIRLMRNFGFVDFDNVIYPGTNGKMPEICAAIGLANLETIDFFVRRNIENYAAYSEIFGRAMSCSLLAYDSSVAGNHQYVVVELQPCSPSIEISSSPISMRKTFSHGSTSGPDVTTWSRIAACFRMPGFCCRIPRSSQSVSSSSRRDHRSQRMIAVESPSMFSRNWPATRRRGAGRCESRSCSRTFSRTSGTSSCSPTATCSSSTTTSSTPSAAGSTAIAFSQRTARDDHVTTAARWRPSRRARSRNRAGVRREEDARVVSAELQEGAPLGES